MTVTATLNHAPRTTDTTIMVTAGGDGDAATEGTDYTTVGTVTLTITAGQTSGTESFSLDPTGDDVDEVDETLSVKGSTTATGLSVSSTAVTIVDDDDRGVTVAPTSAAGGRGRRCNLHGGTGQRADRDGDRDADGDGQQRRDGEWRGTDVHGVDLGPANRRSR